MNGGTKQQMNEQTVDGVDLLGLIRACASGTWWQTSTMTC